MTRSEMRILVYGASGVAGRLVARALGKGGARLVLAGRDRDRLQGLSKDLWKDGAEPVEVRVAPAHDARALRAAMDGVRVVVSCAGPFSRMGEPIVAAALESGAHYVDVAGEPAFLREMYERYESRARKAGVVMANGLGFEVGLGDLAAALAARAVGAAVADEIRVAWALRRFRGGPGLRMAALGRLAAPSWVWSVDRWDSAAPFAETRDMDFGKDLGVRPAVSFPSGAVITVPRHSPARRVQTFMCLADAGPFGDLAARAAPLMSPLAGLLQKPLAAYARSLAGMGTLGPEDRKHAEFFVVAEAAAGAARHQVWVSGVDPYGVTAELMACGIGALVAGRAFSPGARAPAELVDPAETLADLAARGYVTCTESPAA